MKESNKEIIKEAASLITFMLLVFAFVYGLGYLFIEETLPMMGYK